MSEYWVSKKKYFCKYCDIYIADDAPSRQQHENGLRHKGNLERFIRNIYKAGEKNKKDQEEERREMKRVEQAAAAAFAQDVSSGLARSSSSTLPTPSTSAAAKKPPPKPTNPFANYSTAASLGYTDPDAEQLAAALEARRSQGIIAGEWQVVDVLKAEAEAEAEDQEGAAVGDGEDGILKRPADAPPEEDVRAFKLRKRTLQAGLGEIYDPGVIAIKPKKKEEPTEQQVPPTSETKTEPEATSLPKWTAVQLKPIQLTKSENPSSETSKPSGAKWVKPQWSEPIPEPDPSQQVSIFGPPPSEQGNVEDHQHDDTSGVKLEVKEEEQKPILSDEPSAPTGLFKKRKAPAGAGRSRRPA